LSSINLILIHQMVAEVHKATEFVSNFLTIGAPIRPTPNLRGLPFKFTD
jgi:hypothetical protein